MLDPIDRRVFTGTALAGALSFSLSLSLAPALAAGGPTKLFSVVTEKDETVVALTKEDAALGDDAAAVGKALRERGSLTVWRYAVRKAKDGELEQAPLAKISVQATGTLRIQPYRTPLRVVPVE